MVEQQKKIESAEHKQTESSEEVLLCYGYHVFIVSQPSLEVKVTELETKHIVDVSYKRLLPVGKDIFYFLETCHGFGNNNGCGYFVNDGKGQFEEQARCKLRRARMRPALFHMQKKWVFACNGFLTRTAERYNIELDQWRLIPAMNKDREGCSGCALNESIYVFGGYSNTISEY